MLTTADGKTLFSGPGLTDIASFKQLYIGKHFIVDNYLSSSEHVRRWFGRKTISYSRTISEYMNAFSHGGLRIVDVEEPMPLEGAKDANPCLYSLLVRIPNFIFITAEKIQ